MSENLIPCFVVVRDETDYNGERTYPRVCFSEDEADEYITQAASRELEGRDRISASDWIPRFYVEESVCLRGNLDVAGS